MERTLPRELEDVQRIVHVLLDDLRREHLLKEAVNSDRELPKEVSDRLVRHYSSEDILSREEAVTLASYNLLALEPPFFSAIYRGLYDVSDRDLQRMLGKPPDPTGGVSKTNFLSSPDRDLSWSTKVDEAVKFAESVYTLQDPDPDLWMVVMEAGPDARAGVLLDADRISEIPEVGEQYHPMWHRTLASVIRVESEVIAFKPIRVIRIWYAKDMLTLSRLIFQNLVPGS